MAATYKHGGIITNLNLWIYPQGSGLEGFRWYPGLLWYLPVNTLLGKTGFGHPKWEKPGKTQCAYSIRFWIGMLSTTRRLETLQGLKKGGQNYTFCPILMKNKGRNTAFSSFLLKYRVETIQIFQRPEKGGSKWRNICSNLHIVSYPIHICLLLLFLGLIVLTYLPLVPHRCILGLGLC